MVISALSCQPKLGSNVSNYQNRVAYLMGFLPSNISLENKLRLMDAN